MCISSCTDDLINGREWAAAARGGEGGGWAAHDLPNKIEKLAHKPIAK